MINLLFLLLSRLTPERVPCDCGRTRTRALFAPHPQIFMGLNLTWALGLGLG